MKEINALPLPNIEYTNNAISKIVSTILSLKAGDKNSDISELEFKIDQLVYKLYELTEEEIKIIENS